MWVEVEVRVKAKQGDMTGDAIAQALKQDMPQLRRAMDGNNLEQCRRKYEQSQHCTEHDNEYIPNVLAADDTPSEKVYWLSGPTSLTEFTLIMVSELKGSAAQADSFAIQVYTAVEKSIPSAYNISSHQIRIEDITHRFRVVQRKVAVPMTELVVLVFVAVFWTVGRSVWDQKSLWESFTGGVLVNAIFAAVTVLVNWGYRLLTSESKRKVEYIYG